MTCSIHVIYFFNALKCFRQVSLKYIIKITICELFPKAWRLQEIKIYIYFKDDMVLKIQMFKYSFDSRGT